jgi:hypothetical protein
MRAGWRRWRWLVATLVALVALVLGYVGFGEQNPRLSAADRLYSALLLFRFVTDTQPPFPGTLEIARWLAPLPVAYALFQAISAIFAKQWMQFRVWLTRDHVVICGLGRSGLLLAKSFREETSSGADSPAREGMPVAVIDRSTTIGHLEACRDLGIAVLTGDATDRDILRLAGLKRAKYLVVVCGDDAVNSEVMLAALPLTRSRGRRPRLRCFIQIADEQLCGLLEEIALGESDERAARFEWFNVYALGAKALLDAHALGGQSPHLIVAGAGPIGLNLVAEAARRWSLEPHPAHIRITLVAPDAVEQCEKLAARYKQLPSVCDLVPHPVDPADVSRPGRELKIDHPSGNASTTAFVCLEDDGASLRATVQVRRALPSDIKVVACTTGSSGIASVLRGSTGGVLSAVEEFALLDIVCRPEVLLDSAVERVAEAIHENYRSYRRKHPKPDDDPNDSAMKSWDALPEVLRESNRAAASGLEKRLELVECDLVPRDEWGANLQFTNDELERLAKLEHERWRSERKRAGIRKGPKRDPLKAMTNPSMRRWKKLSEEVRDIDRELVRSLPACLARGGFAIVRRRGPATPAVGPGSSEQVSSVTETPDAGLDGQNPPLPAGEHTRSGYREADGLQGNGRRKSLMTRPPEAALEILAQAIHADYVRRRREQGPASDDPALASWDALPETLRHSNRDQARDIGRKLAAVGCELVPSADRHPPPAVEFTKPEIEYLARLEHDRWRGERQGDGWRSGPARDAERKLSPYLVPWESLTEDVRDLDRDTVRGLPGLLAVAGFTVRRAEAAGAVGPKS